jgi:hypothetical protein
MPAANWQRGGCSGRADLLSRRAALSMFGGGLALGNAPVRAISIEPAAWGDLGVQIEAARLEQGGWLRGRLIKPADVATLQFGGTEVSVDPTGRFFIGFDRDAGPVAFLKATCADGRTCSSGRGPAEFGMTIGPRAWQIERINAPLRPPVVPGDEFLRLRKIELAQISAARAKSTEAQGWLQAMIRPAPGRISGRFGAQRIYQGQPGAYHTGLDLAAAAGTPILAPADGVVILAAQAPFTLEGKLLMVDHGMGLSSAFLHCSAHRVTEGEAVKQGQAIAAVGMTGRATGPHLHWGLRWREARLDPLLFLPREA